MSEVSISKHRKLGDGRGRGRLKIAWKSSRDSLSAKSFEQKIEKGHSLSFQEGRFRP
jgi:hypothetical protein